MNLKIFLLAAFVASTFAFSIPGVSIYEYKKGDVIGVYANELDSIQTQLNFDYYYLNYCGKEGANNTEENLGSLLLGETSEITPYEIKMGQQAECKTECKKELSEKDVERFKWIIDRSYFVNLVADSLPAIYNNGQTSHVGFPVGYKEGDDYYIYNHLTFLVELSPLSKNNKSRIVGFNIMPLSVGVDEFEKEVIPFCNQEVKVGEAQKLGVGPIYYSYDVNFLETNKTFGSRWDNYRFLGQEKIHWISLLNSLTINIVLTAIIGYILKRTVNNDIRMYNEVRTSEDVQEDSGWKQLARDVFRPPKHALLLAVFVGTGIQIGSMVFLTLLFACFGFMEQSYRGSLLTTIILLYNFLGAFSGYHSARIYKMFNGTRWILCTLLTGLLYPTINFLIFYVINIMLILEESSAAVHIGTIFALIALWFGISIPLVFLGSLIGYKKTAIQNPSKYNPIPKFIKPQPWYLNFYIVCILGGLLPFGAVFIELVYIMMSIWRHSFYYLFAFLFVVALVLVVTCAEISIVITYLELCSGNHRVWWRSFMATGSMAIYIFAYSIFYYIKELNIVRFSSMFLYFGYMFAFSQTIFIMCGTIGFLSSFVFIRKIYASIKID